MGREPPWNAMVPNPLPPAVVVALLTLSALPTLPPAHALLATVTVVVPLLTALPVAVASLTDQALRRWESRPTGARVRPGATSLAD